MANSQLSEDGFSLISLGTGRNIGHELGHTMGLDDFGKGPYYSSGGIMEYNTTNSVSDDDVKDVIKYTNDVLNGMKGKAKVKVIENIGKPSDDSPIKIEKK